MQYYGNNDWRDYHLSHHGILGMHWGKRNGPPYPLGPSDHSASEKKAGWRQSLGSGKNAELKANKKKAKQYQKQLNDIEKQNDQIEGMIKNLTEVTNANYRVYTKLADSYDLVKDKEFRARNNISDKQLNDLKTERDKYFVETNKNIDALRALNKKAQDNSRKKDKILKQLSADKDMVYKTKSGYTSAFDKGIWESLEKDGLAPNRYSAVAASVSGNRYKVKAKGSLMSGGKSYTDPKYKQEKRRRYY